MEKISIEISTNCDEIVQKVERKIEIFKINSGFSILENRQKFSAKKK